MIQFLAQLEEEFSQNLTLLEKRYRDILHKKTEAYDQEKIKNLYINIQDSYTETPRTYEK